MSNIVPQFQSPGHTSKWLATLQPQMALALPKHLNVERMTRLVLTAFSGNSKLAECTPQSVAASVMTASQLGLEPGVNGQGYLIPYYDNKKRAYICTFVPGWKGLVDLANRGGRCTVWTGAVYRGDDFDYQLGDSPFVRHKPGDSVESFDTLLYVYAIGRIKGQEVPVIEVWSRNKVVRHLDLFNQVGDKHYALKGDMINFEMYARKIPLLQVLKYMPQSIELTAAMAANNAAEEGRTINIDGATWVTTEDDAPQQGRQDQPDEQPKGKPALSDADLAKKKPSLMKAVNAGQSVNEIVTALETMNTLTQDQRMEIASWATQGEAA